MDDMEAPAIDGSKGDDQCEPEAGEWLVRWIALIGWLPGLGQTVHPLTGRSNIAKTDPFAHIGLPG